MVVLDDGTTSNLYPCTLRYIEVFIGHMNKLSASPECHDKHEDDHCGLDEAAAADAFLPPRPLTLPLRPRPRPTRRPAPMVVVAMVVVVVAVRFFTTVFGVSGGGGGAGVRIQTVF
jgi:hypothetical protein